MKSPHAHSEEIQIFSENIEAVKAKARAEIEYLNTTYLADIKRTLALARDDEAIGSKMTAATIRKHELEDILEVPYFTELISLNPLTHTTKPIRIGKFSLTEGNVYSWVAPIGALRFEDPGVKTYEVHSGDTRTITVDSKYDVMIRNNEMVFLSKTYSDHHKEVLLQKEVEEHKKAFLLKDIVDRMEGYQDKIIRLPYFGKMTITGPAGSGKTTLALHRIAYLKLIPLYEKIFHHKQSLVVVKDTSSKEYFKELLPSLGITSAKIETYEELLKEILDLSNKKSYSRKELTNMAHEHTAKKMGFVKTKTVNTIKMGKPSRSTSSTKIQYDIILVDEFQNYSLSELSVFDHLVDQSTQAIMYIGDIHQTIHEDGVGIAGRFKELHSDARHIHVGVSYRNTKEIIEYIEARGHKTQNASPKRSGPVVTEESTTTSEQLISLIQNCIESKSENIHGVVVPAELYESINSAFKETEFCKILTYQDSQGFEFESTLVILNNELPTSEINQNLEYIALTRAMNEMSVLKLATI